MEGYPRIKFKFFRKIKEDKWKIELDGILDNSMKASPQS